MKRFFKSFDRERNKRSHSLSAKRGIERKQLLFKKRSEAAKKGWITRRKNARKGIRIEVGYKSGTVGNSYFLLVDINTHKKLSDANTVTVISRLAGAGHFDDMQDDTSDLQWATFYNHYTVEGRNVAMPRGSAVLVEFYRL